MHNDVGRMLLFWNLKQTNHVSKNTGEDNNKLGLEPRLVWAHSMKQISFTCNSFQIFSLEFNFWLSHQNHSLGNLLNGCLAIRLSGNIPSIYNYYIDQNPRQFCSANENQSDHVTVILVGRSEIKFQWKYLKGIGCEWDLLHGMSSNYPQTAGKRNLFMHNCEGKYCQIFF